jgi:hypothetical protein
MEGILRIWKAKYLDETNEVFPLMKYNLERWNFKKGLSVDDFYKDVVVIKSKMYAFDEDEWYKIGREEELDKIVVHFNDFVNNFGNGELEVYYDGYFEASEDVPFDNIVLGQREGCFNQRLDLVYDVPIEVFEERNKRLLKG